MFFTLLLFPMVSHFDLYFFVFCFLEFVLWCLVFSSKVGTVFSIFGLRFIWGATPLLVLAFGGDKWYGHLPDQFFPCSMCSLTYAVLGWSWGDNGSWCFPGGVSFVLFGHIFFLKRLRQEWWWYGICSGDRLVRSPSSPLGVSLKFVRASVSGVFFPGKMWHCGHSVYIYYSLCIGSKGGACHQGEFIIMINIKRKKGMLIYI